MPDLIRRYDNKNQPIITPETTILSSTYFNLVRLKKGEEHEAMIEGFETLYAVLSGNVEIEVNGTAFKDVGRRRCPGARQSGRHGSGRGRRAL